MLVQDRLSLLNYHPERNSSFDAPVQLDTALPLQLDARWLLLLGVNGWTECNVDIRELLIAKA